MGTVKMAFARQRGTSHILNGTPCQDSVYGVAGFDGYCVALADGAGSVPESENASEAVVQAVAEEFAENFAYWYGLDEAEFAERLVGFCREAVESRFPDMEAACTLLTAAISLEGQFLLCHIGDGILFGVSENGETNVISVPENGEEPNQTFFLSGNRAAGHIRRYKELPDNCTALMLCSDGAGASLWNGLTDECAAAVKIMAEWVGKDTQEAVSARISAYLDELFRNNTEDDMSIAVLSWKEIQEYPIPSSGN